MRSFIAVALLFCLGLFAQSGIASTDAVPVYAATDYSALAPPDAQPLAAQSAFDNYIENRNVEIVIAGTIAVALVASYDYIAAGPQRQDFL